MTQMIAVVATAVFLDGKRTVIQPGHPIPELSEHDAEALGKSGAAFDPVLSQEAKEKVEAAALAAAGEFQAARERVQAEAASTQVAPQERSSLVDPAAGTATEQKPAAKGQQAGGRKAGR
ncbi:hypothetical protein G8A07_15585 [Roseateles sp. DAIF2]|uniref:hypothetical protein n=1 Tax=Roseateles sp. DAIF2 TaxID=2714952 RepID=UPI0018A32A7B|nr:hypothetical protein [Roseateles sp. DAIF2]QPF74197.1 hypothetical protein G8A07_15585 [Roseateles sp. DAIF2]